MKRYLKTMIAAAAAVVLAASVSACGSSSESTGAAEETEAPAEEEEAAEEAEEAEETEAEEAEETEAAEEAQDSGSAETAESASGSLIVYTSLPQSVTDRLMEEFNSAYPDIQVDLISAGGGELVSRIAAESENPQGDVLLSGTISAMSSYSDYFEDYTTANEADILDGFKNEEGNMTRFDIIGSVIMINTDLIGDIEINGYADLLNPELKGKIAMADPSASSSAYEHVVNMLEDMGGADSEEAWDYVRSFCEQLDGKLLSGSSAVYKGVMEGEYVVGLSSEGSAANCIAAGADNIEIIYMEEGVIFRGDGVYLIKGCPDEANAKIFMDFCTSLDIQQLCSDELCMRSVHSGVVSSGILPSIDQINVITDDEEAASANKGAYIEQFTDIFTDVS